MKFRTLLFALSCFLWGGLALSQVNINTATREELDALKGIGEARANAIIKYREENGPFKTVGELRNVPNFPDSLVGKLGKQITVGGAAPRFAAPPASRSPARPSEKSMTPIDKPVAREPARPAAPAMPARPAQVPSPAVAAPTPPATPRPATLSASAAPARPAMPGQPAAPARHEVAEPAPALPLGKPAAPPAPARPAMAN